MYTSINAIYAYTPNEENKMMSSDICIQVQTKEGGSNYIKYASTTYIEFSPQACFSGVGIPYSNPAVLESVVACSNGGSVEGTYTPHENGTEKTVKAALTSLNLHNTRATLVDDILLLVMPVHAQCEFESNELKERAVLAAAALKCGLDAAIRLYPSSRPAVVLKFAAMDADVLSDACANKGFAAYFHKEEDTDLVSFVFALPANAPAPTIISEGSTVSFVVPASKYTIFPGDQKQIRRHWLTINRVACALVTVALAVALVLYFVIRSQ